MKRFALLGLTMTAAWACIPAHEDENPGQCATDQTALYSRTTPPSAGENGASGIAAAPAVLSSSTTSGADGGATGSSTSGSTVPFASTTATCVPAVCPANQVAVPRVATTANSGASEEPTTSGVDTPRYDPSSDAGVPATSDAGTYLCVAPPPACGSGQSPSYAPAGFWHCLPLCDPTNSNLVVISYGGTFRNGGVCAPPPPAQACGTAGQVWTWNYLTEAWECEAECDNGLYDRHTYGTQIVCVPC